jgi:DnaJ-class molecular chaperone
MRPRFKKVGDKVTITCPDCDGTGLNTKEPSLDLDETTLENTPKCFNCKGTGQVEGIVTKQ